VEQSQHDPQGNASGEFAQYVDTCRSGRALGIAQRQFGHVRYRNASPDRLLPLYNCLVERLEIVGQFLYRTWDGITILRGDLSHSGGIASWSRVNVNNTSLKSFNATMLCVDSVFQSCDFKLSNLIDPIFIRCVFARVKLRDLNLIRPRFVACEFKDVDLSDSTWKDVGELQVTGTWKAGEALASDSDARAIEFFRI
jgi:hypothetical protein